MPYGLGRQSTVIRIQKDTDKAVSDEALRSAQNFFRQQIILADQVPYHHKVVPVIHSDGSSSVFDYKKNGGQEYLTVNWTSPTVSLPVPFEPVYEIPELDFLAVEFFDGST